MHFNYICYIKIPCVYFISSCIYTDKPNCFFFLKNMWYHFRKIEYIGCSCYQVNPIWCYLITMFLKATSRVIFKIHRLRNLFSDCPIAWTVFCINIKGFILFWIKYLGNFNGDCIIFCGKFCKVSLDSFINFVKYMHPIINESVTS